jgi:uncharacterized membrane protein YqjE
MPDNSDIRPAASPAEPVPQSAFARSLATSVFKYLSARGLLLGIEAREALRHASLVIAWLAIGAVSVLAGWLLLVTSLVGVLSHHLDWSWVTATAVVGAAHILVALSAAFVTWKRVTTARWFADSLNELNKDRAWLQTQTTKG